MNIGPVGECIVWITASLIALGLFLLFVNPHSKLFLKLEIIKKKCEKASKEKVNKLTTGPIITSIIMGLVVIICAVLPYWFSFVPEYIPIIMLFVTMACTIGIIPYALDLLARKHYLIFTLLVSGFVLLLMGQVSALLTRHGQIKDEYWVTIVVLILFVLNLFIAWLTGIRKAKLWVSILLQFYILIILVLSFALVFCNNGIIDTENKIFLKGWASPRHVETQKDIYINTKKDGWKQKTSNLEPYLYFSMITFTTVGYGDYKPSEDSRMLAALEAFLGYTYLGLLLGLILLKLSNDHLTPHIVKMVEEEFNKKYNKSINEQK